MPDPPYWSDQMTAVPLTESNLRAATDALESTLAVCTCRIAGKFNPFHMTAIVWHIERDPLCPTCGNKELA